ncbi:MAG: hypothetical protein HC899_21170 [Leptolyngbyaceae cyanobacterium SM1_4_3]|nr:hypothetical protein [Leptolyngbyaceae cyanobacterium SM1_4_3]NJN01880.1 hypothetical protein [Leptolyngbyaceae cyanobacterium RM1_1_2]
MDKPNIDIIEHKVNSGGSLISDCSNDWTEAEVFEEIGAITRQFDILECADCARAILRWLHQHGIPGRLLKLKTRYGEDYILSTRLEKLDITESITINGKHYGVEVYERVFDNLSEQGLSREEWIRDFKCHSGEFTLVEIERL